jgi:hypothetical protein
MEQGDNVTYMLEKDRERLKQELEFEKAQTKKLERELKRASSVRDEDRAASAKHKQVALMLIRGRARLVQTLVELRTRCTELEAAAAESRRSEAASEERHLEADFEREQLRARLARAEAQNRELRLEIERMRGGGVSTGGSGIVRPTASHPHVYISERTVSPTPPPAPSSADIRRTPTGNAFAAAAVPKLSPEANDLSTAMAKKVTPPVLHDVTTANVPAVGHAALPTVQPAGAGNAVRKMAPVGRGAPPPIPPNKPQVVIVPQGTTIIRPSSATCSGLSSPPSKLGVAAASKDRTMLPMPDGVVGATAASVIDRSANRAPSPRFVAPPSVHLAPAVRPDVAAGAVRKPTPTSGAQVCVKIKSQVG